MEMKFTPQQQRVIDTEGKNILVSAAAGSGKTAVLVERIVRMITQPGENGQEPLDIDRLLIVTFTQAAAAQMRERIGLAIERKLEQDPENEHLQRQTALLHNAQITTIDSFCLFVLRNHFHEIDLDPGFRVADEGEMKLLKQDVMAAMLEDYFEKQDEAFLELLESFSPSGSEKPLAEQIDRLFGFAMSFPWPVEWLETCAAEAYGDVNALCQSGWMRTMLEYCRTVFTDAGSMLAQAEQICAQPDGPYMYAEALEDDRERVTAILQALPADLGEAELNGLYERLQTLAFCRLPSKKDDSVSQEKREQVKAIRQSVKDMTAGVRASFFYKKPSGQLDDLNMSLHNVRKLVELTLCFERNFALCKREKNIIDFQDMEHMALRILVHRERGTQTATAATAEYRHYFREVLIDEYQDSNLVQEALLQSVSGEEEGIYNRFMVGDVKQSIYKFRLARPELFLEKYDAYQGQGENRVRIDLRQNFRSRREVIDSVNRVFERIMGRQLGGIEYDDEAALYAGAAYEPGDDYRTELLLYDTERAQEGGLTGREAKEAEARMIAAKIRRMAGHFLITDTDNGGLRPAAYRDMVILLRSNQGWDDVFQRVLKEEGIPVYASGKTGYFAAPEIQTLLHFLRVIDNPYQDIPLYGVLKSVLGGFTEEELAQIKCGVTDGAPEGRKLYARLCAYRGEPAIGGRIARFLELLNECRELASHTSISELLQKILHRTGYLYEMSALPGGEQRQANVEMLLSKAADFEKTSYYGLFHFIRYMEQMEKYEIDYGEANILDENADTVRIMSIHKSKGLEFPICFVAGLAKRFNRMDGSLALLTDVDEGIGAECVDLRLRLRQNTLKKNAMAQKLLLDAQGEELRVLYVAMTRAREKLILTGAVKDCEARLGQAQLWKNSPGKLPFSVIARAGSFLDWILLALPEESTLGVSLWGGSEQTGEEIRETLGTKERRFRLESSRPAGKGKALSETLAERFSFVYPHRNLENLYTKTTVSELKRERMPAEEESAQLFPETEMTPYIPRFAAVSAAGVPAAISATDRGSAYHRVMELLDFAHLPEAKGEREAWLDGQIELQRKSGRLSCAYAEAVNVKKAAVFLQTRLAERMAAADAGEGLYVEQPFVLGIEANRLKPQFPKDETVLVQGIIDVYFEEEDYLVVADYKTDRVSQPEELCRRYRVQLAYYAEALARLTGKPVREKIIYSFALGKEILVE